MQTHFYSSYVVSLPLKYIKSFRYMTIVDIRVDFRSKMDFMNDRCNRVEIIYCPYFFH